MTSGQLTQLRTDAMRIFSACVKAADPEQAVARNLHLDGNVLSFGHNNSIDLSRFSRIIVLGAGKASAAMAKGVERVLGGHISEGLVVVKHGHGLKLKNIMVVESGHPTPTPEGEAAAARMLELAESLSEEDLVVGCFSGGGSALLSLPAPGITLEEKMRVTEQLLKSGADIFEINAVRKHISQIKGGLLLAHSHPAVVVNVLLSDVIGDDPSVIASGPFVQDETTYTKALEVLEKYQLLDTTPVSILQRLSRGAKGLEKETLKPHSPMLQLVQHVIVGSNIISLRAGKEEAERLGYRSLILSSTVRGDTIHAAKFHAYLAEEVRSSGNPVPSPACILSGGETTVKVSGDGLGGRNQHFVLAIVEAASRIERCVFLSAGTDGTDGPTDAAGAMIDSDTWERAAAHGSNPQEYLARNDSYHFFKNLGDLIVTGPTLTNVMDVHLVLMG